ncbi:lysostaphin resistance A-like protein [Bacteroidota bacterium]
MLIYSLLTVFLVGLLFQLLALLLANVIYDTSAMELLSYGENPEPYLVNALKFSQIMGAIGTFILSSFFISFLYTGSWTGFFTFGKLLSIRAVLLLIVIMFVTLPLINYLSEINLKFTFPFDGIESYFRRMEEQTESLMMTMLSAEGAKGLLINLFMIGIIPAIGEELVFRGLIQRHLEGMFKSPHVAIALASVIFSLAHFQVYTFLPRFILGSILGYAYYYGKSLWYPVIAHLFNNTLGVLFYYRQMNSAEELRSLEAMDMIGTENMLPVAALMSLLIAGGLMFYWVRMVKVNQSAHIDRI